MGHDGVPLKGIAPFNNAVAAAIAHDGTIDVLIEAASNPDVGSLFTFEPTHLGDLATAGTEPIYVLRAVDVALRDVRVSHLLHDALVLRGLAGELAASTPRRAEIIAALERMVDVVDPDDVSGTAASGIAALATVLAQPAHASAHLLHAVGHAHIDSAWLWPVRETVRKVSRTFSNVRERRFIPVGGMWVESDTNMPGGEALARQFVEGKNFFLEEFGIDTPEVWLPDSFGYTAALPQIALAGGLAAR